MKSYVVDEVSANDLENIKSYLSDNATSSGMEKLFWVDLPVKNLNIKQKDHVDCCPHRFAIEIGDSWIKAEFFVRTSKKFKCECSGYCNDNQKRYIIRYVDNIISNLNICT